ncbi:hypothetical protein A3218_26550 [Pseudomonas chlororaphis]|uniref:hypothetical protein n=1 Tax=Pseudomonas chlororaphis TaxID=587753 RepID=UPI000789E240|nr:hypothetical protein [Pseudomonas chlororaphis]AMS17678.1 hypothetical protein A3218_26550 [Pseudomonas chlororaphis]
MSQFGVAEYALAFCGVVTLSGGAIISGVFFYWGCKRMDEILGYVKNCKIIMNNRFYLYMGAWGRMAMIGMVAGSLAYPGYYIRKGMMDIEDIRNFPEPLKRRLIKLFNIQLVFAACFIVEFIILKLIRP